MMAYLRQGALLATAAAVGGATAVALGRATFTDHSTTTIRQVAPAAGPSNISSTSTGLNAALVYRRDAPGVVVVNATLARNERGLGSGFVIDRRGHILTNAHVVAGARSVTVGFRKGGTYRATVARRRPDRRRRRPRRAEGAAGAASPAAARIGALGAGRRPRGRDRQPARRVPQHHRGHRLGQAAPDQLAQARLQDLRRDPDRRRDQPRQLRRTADRPLRERHRDHQPDPDRARTTPRAATSASGSPFPSTPPAPSPARSSPPAGRCTPTSASPGSSSPRPSPRPSTCRSTAASWSGSSGPARPPPRPGVRGGSATATVDGETLTVGGDIIVSIDGRAVVQFSDLAETIAGKQPGRSRHPGDHPRGHPHAGARDARSTVRLGTRFAPSGAIRRGPTPPAMGPRRPFLSRNARQCTSTMTSSTASSASRTASSTRLASACAARTEMPGSDSSDVTTSSLRPWR